MDKSKLQLEIARINWFATLISDNPWDTDTVGLRVFGLNWTCATIASLVFGPVILPRAMEIKPANH